LHCPGPGPCTCQGMVFDEFRVRRTNFGIPDNNNDRTPDGASINLALVEREPCLMHLLHLHMVLPL
jgi:hypothetical protein